MEQVDEYTSLLIEMVRGNSNEWRESVVKKAVDMIDLKVIDGLPCSTIEELSGKVNIESSAHEELVRDIECRLWIILGLRTSMVCLLNISSFNSVLDFTV